MAKKKDESEAMTKSHFVRCRYCGQKNAVKADYKNNSANCGKCKLPLSNEGHKKFADLNKHEYIHPLDSKALAALRAIPGLTNTPVAIVTGDYYLDDAQAGEIAALGAQLRYKPLWLEELVTLARELLNVGLHH